MDNTESLQRILNRARRALQIMEEEKASYGIRIPVDLQIELEEKQKEVISLEARITQLEEGGKPANVPDNLPRYNNVFVGRKSEMAKCLGALSQEERGWGVVIDGIGGMGKTALALEVAHQARQEAMFDAYLFASAKTTRLSPDGVRQETLALSSLDAFCREFARILGKDEVVRITNAIERRYALLDALRGRRVLLIWDNLETLTIEERDQITELLRRLPSPNKAIITSRRRTGESALTIRLDKLSFSEASDMMQQVGKQHIKVFQELQPAGITGQQSLYDAAGGNPLALDWTLGLIAQKGYSFLLALDRLRNAASSGDLYGFLFADSVQGLANIDGALLSVLSVFLAPVKMKVLVDILELAPTEVCSGLERLVTLSLVNDLEGGRYGLHPLTRNYVTIALGRTLTGMQASVDPVTQLDPIAQRKALQYWVTYAQKYGEGNGAYRTFDKLEAEWLTLEGIANILREQSGIPEAIKDRQAAQLLVSLEYALCNFLWFRGYWDERIRLGDWCYQSARGLEQWNDAGWGAQGVAWIYYNRAETERAAIWANRMEDSMLQGSNRRDQIVATLLQGQVAEQKGQWEEAERRYQSAVLAYRELENEEDEALALNSLGMLARKQSQYNLAQGYYEEALAIAEKLKLIENIANCCGNLGLLAINRNRPGDARTYYERALFLAQTIGRQDLVANAQSGIASVLEKEGAYPEALELAQQALKIQERLRDLNLPFSQQQVEQLQRRMRE